MAELPIQVQISEINGAYYPARLQCVPKVGELINLWSLMDQAAGLPLIHHYEVVQLVHHISDVTEKEAGTHVIIVYVKPTQSALISPHFGSAT